MNNEKRMEQLARECRERASFQKFIRYCQMEGLGSVDAEDDRYYSAEQEQFFRKYEKQMTPVL